MSEEKNSQADGNKIILPDFAELWKEVYFKTEGAWADAFKEFVSTDTFVKMLDQSLTQHLNLEKVSRQNMDKLFEMSGVPSKKDLSKIAELVISVEEKVDNMDYQVVDNINKMADSLLTMLGFMENSQQQMNAIKLQTTELDKKINEMHRQNTEMQTQVVAVKTQNTELQSLFTEAKTQNTVLQTQIMETVTQNAELQSQMGSITKQNTELYNQLVDFKKQNTQLKTQLTDMKKQITVFNQKLTVLNGKNDGHNQKARSSNKKNVPDETIEQAEYKQAP